MSKRGVGVKCPYCGTIHTALLDNDWGGKQILLCYPDNGGCDRYFVADIRITIEAKGLKIEGEE